MSPRSCPSTDLTLKMENRQGRDHSGHQNPEGSSSLLHSFLRAGVRKGNLFPTSSAWLLCTVILQHFLGVETLFQDAKLVNSKAPSQSHSGWLSANLKKIPSLYLGTRTLTLKSAVGKSEHLSYQTPKAPRRHTQTRART